MTEKNWNAVAISAVIVMGGLLVLNFAFPVPSLGRVVSKNSAERAKLTKEIEDDRLAVSATRTKNAQRLWVQPADQVAAAAMAKVNEAAVAQSLKVIAFRPQRAQDDDGVTRLPYQVTLEGYFPKVIAFIKTLETPKLKLPVVSVQIASADGASDKVNATIGIVAYRELETVKP